MNPKIKTKPVCLTCLFFVFSGLFVFWTDYIIAWDMTEYLAHGTNMTVGRGYVDSDGSPKAQAMIRGPIFSWLISKAQSIGGISAASGFWVVRIFCMLAPVGIFLFGNCLFGYGVGFTAGLFYLFSHPVMYCSYRHIDIVWTVLVLIGLYAAWRGLEAKSLFWSSVSGLFISLAYLTKESAVVFFGVPFAFWLLTPNYHSREGLKQIGVFFVTLIVPILPWAIYIYLFYGELYLLGVAGPWVLDLLTGIVESSIGVGDQNNSVGGITKIIYSFSGYFSGNQRHGIFANFPLAWFFPLAWLYASVSAFKFKNYRMLTISGLAYLPVIYYIGLVQERLDQSLPIIGLTYIALSSMLWAFASVIGKWLIHINFLEKKREFSLSIYVVFFLVSALLFIQVKHTDTYGRSIGRFLSNNGVVRALTGGQLSLREKGWTNSPGMSEALKYIKNNIPVEDIIMVGNYPTARSIFVNLAGKRLIYDLPIQMCLEEAVIGKVENTTTLGEIPVYLSSGTRITGRFTMVFVFQSQVLKQVLDTGARWVLISNRGLQLFDYFDKHPGFEKVLFFRRKLDESQGLTLYRVVGDANTLSSIEFPGKVTARTRKAFRIMKNEHPGLLEQRLTQLNNCLHKPVSRSALLNWLI